MLKTQINPHFLFNTLNSIYVLAMKKSEQTANTVMKLSDILDYILYKIDAPRIPLSTEIQIIENYIELEKIRFTDRVTLNFTSAFQSKDIQIPPMLIIPFIENAFKHGVAKSMEKSWIKVSIQETGQRLNIAVSNSKGQSPTKSEAGGIGLIEDLVGLECGGGLVVECVYRAEIRHRAPQLRFGVVDRRVAGDAR